MDYGKKERIGGFDLLKYKNVDGMSFIKVTTIMGNWSMEHREGSNLYEFINAERTKERDEAIHIMFVNAYMSATIAEADYQHDLLVAAGELDKRINSDVQQISEEEDAELLKKMKADAEIEEEVRNGEERAAQAEV